MRVSEGLFHHICQQPSVLRCEGHLGPTGIITTTRSARRLTGMYRTVHVLDFGG